ncbi:hypothetical protein [Siphonobacter sp. SORGH_AS_0500]|uniref:hypothetical protein n=1 Tax=Siphonobacter sp. SORGH_AS_0500 TaxID=1864824 RepID=UPI0028575198|nr:hypothetical protein [Siphonobacter sp. SORGH_AS_0500]MDR6197325.1 hypothetical protein [Siphonobacter sp. SORGH_AS_0500]
MFHTLEGTAQTRVEVLGYASELVEYRQGFDARLLVQPTSMGLAVSAVNGQRLYTNNQWPNPVVLKISNVTYKPIQTQDKRDVIDGAH